MQTISLIPEECTDDYLVFATSEPHRSDVSSPAAPSPDSSQEDNTALAQFNLPLTAATRSALRRLLGDAADATGSANSSNTATTAEGASQFDDSDSSHADSSPAVDNEKDSDDHATADIAESDSAESDSAGSGSVTPEQSESVRASSTPTVVLTPREIQARIRGGESIEDLVRASGMSQGKIEPFAHPILAERERMTTVARQSHPVRQDGPSTLTLDDVLATAFTARGMDLSEATWDAYRNDARLWIITLTWASGISDVTAEWSYHSDGLSATTVARNEAATELVDPDFGRPSPGRAWSRTRSQGGSTRFPSSTSSDNRSQESGQIHGLHTDGDPDFDYDETAEDFDDATPSASPSSPNKESADGDEQPGADTDEQSHSHPSRATGGRGRRTQRRRTGRMEIVGLDDHRSRRANQSSRKGSPTANDHQHRGGGPASTSDDYDGSNNDHASNGHAGSSSDNEDAFLQHPDSESRPRRRRKAVTPHWEDVLLGVRTNRSDPPRNRGNHTRDHD